MSGNDEVHPPKDKVSRRNFLYLAAGASAGVVGVAAFQSKLRGPLLTQKDKDNSASRPASSGKSTVAVIRNEGVFAEDELVETEVDRMLSAGMAALSLSSWGTLFKPGDIVGIKVNCIAGPQLSTHPLVVHAVVGQLQKAGIPAENIIIWDRTNRELTRAGYSLNTGKKGVKCYGTDAVGYEEKASAQKSFNGRLSKILTRQITALINMPILKDHGGAGVTIAMKNHYGSFDNPGSHHKNLCDPYIADLNSLDDIRAKTRLIICDATRATCNGGPGFNPAFVWRYKGLLLSRDPVALDTVGTQIIDERRVKVGLQALEQIGRYPRQLASAAERGLGNTDSARIDIRSKNISASV